MRLRSENIQRTLIIIEWLRSSLLPSYSLDLTAENRLDPYYRSLCNEEVTDQSGVSAGDARTDTRFDSGWVVHQLMMGLGWPASFNQCKFRCTRTEVLIQRCATLPSPDTRASQRGGCMKWVSFWPQLVLDTGSADLCIAGRGVINSPPPTR